MDSLPNERSLAFEDAYLQLREIVDSLDNGRDGLEASLDKFEKGMELLNLCRSKLAGAARRIEALKGTDADNGPVLEEITEIPKGSDEDATGVKGQEGKASKKKDSSKTTKTKAIKNSKKSTKSSSDSETHCGSFLIPDLLETNDEVIEHTEEVKDNRSLSVAITLGDGAETDSKRTQMNSKEGDVSNKVEAKDSKSNEDGPFPF